MNRSFNTARQLPGAPELAESPRPEQACATRQALFPLPATPMVSADALQQAEQSLHNLGFRVRLTSEGAWELHWPGSRLTVWRHSAAELCYFAQDQARRYAKQALQQSGEASLPSPSGSDHPRPRPQGKQR